jgi:simple sugar transport system substrate-binding protein
MAEFVAKAGFYTVMVLFIYKISGGLTGPSDINTGLNFVTKANVDLFLHTQGICCR